MKKALIFILTVALFLAGCANTGKDSGTASNSASSGSGPDKGYFFKTDDNVIYMHDLAAPVLDKLGDPKEYFEAPSCAFQGIEKTYTYSSFSLLTYELDKVDHVASIILLDDSIETPEGITLNSSLDDVMKAYGSNYEKTLGLYSYKSGKMKISFLIEDDHVTSIEYIALSGE